MYCKLSVFCWTFIWQDKTNEQYKITTKWKENEREKIIWDIYMSSLVSTKVLTVLLDTLYKGQTEFSVGASWNLRKCRKDIYRATYHRAEVAFNDLSQYVRRKIKIFSFLHIDCKNNKNNFLEFNSQSDPWLLNCLHDYLTSYISKFPLSTVLFSFGALLKEFIRF